MSRYIDADKLIEELQEEIDFKTTMYTEEQNQYFSAGLKCAYRDVKSQPTANVAPIADTVRELAERLKARKVSYGNITFRVVPVDDIDQIAKEMLEGETQ